MQNAQNSTAWSVPDCLMNVPVVVQFAIPTPQGLLAMHAVVREDRGEALLVDEIVPNKPLNKHLLLKATIFRITQEGSIVASTDRRFH